MAYRQLARVPRAMRPDKIKTRIRPARWGRNVALTALLPSGLGRDGILAWLRRRGFRKQPAGPANTYVRKGYAAVVLPRR